MKPRWKPAQAAATLQEIATDIAAFFNVPCPTISKRGDGQEWEWCFDDVEIWTKAGRAECNVRIDASFAHLYFRFADPARAIPFDDHMGRLNRCSGKWNAIATPGDYVKPQDSLDVFRASLRRDFRKVAETNPPADEVAAYRAKEEARQAQFNLYLETRP